jgi:hypothetical protein
MAWLSHVPKPMESINGTDIFAPRPINRLLRSPARIRSFTTRLREAEAKCDNVLISSIRRECTDHLIVFSEEHLRRILTKYASYYNEVRTHIALGKDAPCTRLIERFGDVVAHPILGGLHHRYARIFAVGGTAAMRRHRRCRRPLTHTCRASLLDRKVPCEARLFLVRLTKKQQPHGVPAMTGRHHARRRLDGQADARCAIPVSRSTRSASSG